MKRYYKETDGGRVWLEGMLIHEGRQIINPTEEQILAAGYVEYVPASVSLTEEQNLANMKTEKIRQILANDESNSVNECFIIHNGVTLPYWADRDERIALDNAVQKRIRKGLSTYRLDIRNLGISIEVDCNGFLDMLADLEVYAIDCYNKTTDHIFAVNALTTTEEVIDYDYTVGYPEKPSFVL